MIFKSLKLTRDEQALHYYMQGDKNKQLEPPEVILHFPCGQVSVTRCKDQSYWVHVHLEDLDDDDNIRVIGKVTHARIDLTNKGVNETDVGELGDPNLKHFAVKMEKV
jgi:hypothetical protein